MNAPLQDLQDEVLIAESALLSLTRRIEAAEGTLAQLLADINAAEGMLAQAGKDTNTEQETYQGVMANIALQETRQQQLTADNAALDAYAVDQHARVAALNHELQMLRAELAALDTPPIAR